jgi:hypothetical protein
MSTTTRFAAAVAAGLLTIGLAAAPATALRVAPVEPGSAAVAVEPVEDTSLLLSMGRVAAHTDPSPVSTPESTPELVMSIGRLPR